MNKYTALILVLATLTIAVCAAEEAVEEPQQQHFEKVIRHSSERIEGGHHHGERERFEHRGEREHRFRGGGEEILVPVEFRGGCPAFCRLRGLQCRLGRCVRLEPVVVIGK